MPTHLVPVDEYRARVLDAVPRLPARLSPIRQDCVLAADVTSRWPVPLFDNSGMDGYAVRAAEASDGAVLRIVADVPAGSSDDPDFGPGEAVRIMTGAPVPTAADAIVPLEDTDLGTAISAEPPPQITVTAAPEAGAHIRRAGGDTAAGDVVVAAGTVLRPWQLSAIASAGRADAEIYLPPRVAVVSTGSELVTVDHSTELQRGQIPESNSVLLAAAVRAAGAELAWTATIPDDEAALAELVESLDVDAVIFSGGVSVGAFDVVKAVLSRVGGVDFTTVAMQPGKPQGFGLITDVGPRPIPVFCLPGNPVSAAVSFEMFVRPALRTMAHRPDIDRPLVTRRAARSWHKRPGRMQILPVVYDADTVAPASHGGSGSHLVTSLADARALALIPADVERVEEGDTVTVMVTE